LTITQICHRQDNDSSRKLGNTETNNLLITIGLLNYWLVCYAEMDRWIFAMERQRLRRSGRYLDPSNSHLDTGHFYQ